MTRKGSRGFALAGLMGAMVVVGLTGTARGALAAELGKAPGSAECRTDRDCRMGCSCIRGVCHTVSAGANSLVSVVKDPLNPVVTHPINADAKINIAVKNKPADPLMTHPIDIGENVIIPIVTNPINPVVTIPPALAPGADDAEQDGDQEPSAGIPLTVPSTEPTGYADGRMAIPIIVVAYRHRCYGDYATFVMDADRVALDGAISCLMVFKGPNYAKGDAVEICYGPDQTDCQVSVGSGETAMEKAIKEDADKNTVQRDFSSDRDMVELWGIEHFQICPVPNPSLAGSNFFWDNWPSSLGYARPDSLPTYAEPYIEKSTSYVPSSIPVIVELFQHANFEGKTIHVIKSLEDLTFNGFDDSVSSMRIWKGPDWKEGCKVSFYDWVGYVGDSFVVESDQISHLSLNEINQIATGQAFLTPEQDHYELASLNDNGLGDLQDAISSVRIQCP